MEAEHYPNGVLESMSTRIVNGAYKHEDLQTDESSMGEGRALAWCSVGADAPLLWEGVGTGRQLERP